MRFNKTKAKIALLAINKTQSELAESLELSRRWVGAAFNGGSISEKKSPPYRRRSWRVRGKPDGAVSKIHHFTDSISSIISDVQKRQHLSINQVSIPL